MTNDTAESALSELRHQIDRVKQRLDTLENISSEQKDAYAIFTLASKVSTIAEQIRRNLGVPFP